MFWIYFLQAFFGGILLVKDVPLLPTLPTKTLFFGGDWSDKFRKKYQLSGAGDSRSLPSKSRPLWGKVFTLRFLGAPVNFC